MCHRLCIFLCVIFCNVTLLVIEVYADVMAEYTLYIDFHFVYFLKYAFFDDFMLRSADGNPAVLQCDDIVGIAGSEIDVMDDDYDRLALLAHEPPQNLHDLY